MFILLCFCFATSSFYVSFLHFFSRRILVQSYMHDKKNLKRAWYIPTALLRHVKFWNISLSKHPTDVPWYIPTSNRLHVTFWNISLSNLLRACLVQALRNHKVLSPIVYPHGCDKSDVDHVNSVPWKQLLLFTFAHLFHRFNGADDDDASTDTSHCSSGKPMYGGEF